MNLNDISLEIRDLLEKRRKELELTFVEDKHVYYMKDVDGRIKSNFPSVSKVLKKFYTPFDAEGKSLQMCNGDPIEAEKLQEQWRAAGDYSTNMGSRVHYELEIESLKRNGDYKEVRKPIFQIDESQQIKSDSMIIAGKKFLDLMEERGAVLLDTEIILGDNTLGYTGQPDKVWLMMNKEKTDFGFVITDWKTNQPKNFEIQHFTGKMHRPFQDYPDTALSHYYLQLPLYGRLLTKMLEQTKYYNIKFLGSVVVLLKEEGIYQEYKVPGDISKKIFEIDITKYTKK